MACRSRSSTTIHRCETIRGRAAVVTWAITQSSFQLRGPERPPGGLGRAAEVEDLLAAASGRLLCLICRQPVTGDDQRVAVEGRNVHRRTNPAGFEFELGCFHQAAGAVAVGEATSEHTWFAGFTWRFSVCRGCGCHLGWLFEAADSCFHGLILDRLKAESSGPEP